jgi:type IV secretion system protein VirD4
MYQLAILQPGYAIATTVHNPSGDAVASITLVGPTPSVKPRVGAVATASASANDDPANAGIRREPELPKHEDIAPEPAKAVHEFEPPEEESDDDAQRLRAFQRNARAVARQVGLDPADNMGL